MTDTASISGLVQSTGIGLPPVTRVRVENAENGETLRPAERQERPARPDRPFSVSSPPLLDSRTQIAAQQPASATQNTGASSRGQSGADEAGNGDASDVDAQGGGSSKRFDPSNPHDLTEEEKKKVQELQQRDREVRAHEQAHKAVGGALASNPTYKTVRGPDGKSYAVSGEVKIDTSPVPNNPEATIRKLEQVKRAALAPTNPSAQDRRVAAEAEAKIQKARQEKREEDAEELEETKGEKNGLTEQFDPAAQAAQQSGFGDTGFSGSRNGPGGAVLSPGSLLNLVA